jgi:hypothetical protein
MSLQRHRNWTLVHFVLVVALAGGCARILGFEDAKPFPEDMTPRDASTNMHQDSSQVGGGGPSGVAGSGGASGATGSGGASGATGSGGGSPDASDSGGGPNGPDGGNSGKLGAPCTSPGAFLCLEHAQPPRLVCDPSSMVWVSAMSCPNGELCDSTNGACRPIVPACAGRMPGDTFCNGATRVTCGVDLVTSTLVSCPTAEHCRLGTGPACAACVDGQVACEGMELKICASDHQSLVHKDTCTTAAPCNATAGACTATFCLPNQYHCNGDTLEKCNAAQTMFDKVADCQPGLCSAVRAHCDTCAPAATTCSMDNVQTCKPDGTGTSVANCPTATPHCIGAGICVACTAPAQCPASSNECAARACTNNNCGTQPLAVNTPVAAQAAGDCKKAVCDGAGGVTSIADTSDVPVDNNPCTDDVCTGSTPSNPPKTGSACNGNAGVCDTRGMCVACMANLSCQPADPCKMGTTSCATGALTCMETGNKMSGTSCGNQTCSGGFKTPAPTCNSNGQCQTQTPGQCPSGSCNAQGTDCQPCAGGQTACSGTCCAPGQGCCNGNACTVLNTGSNCGGCGIVCGAGKVCSGSTCLLQAGQLCSAGGECSSGVCGGRCCNQGASCNCLQPTSANLLTNPGFDTNLAGWTMDPGPGGFNWLSGTTQDANGIHADADDCPFSGAAYVSAPTDTTNQRISQCVAILPQTNYNFGVRIHSVGGAFSNCGVDVYPGAQCTGTPANVVTVQWINVDWSPSLDQSFNSGTTGSTARVWCYVDATNFQGAFFFDQIYLAQTPNHY